MNKDDRKFIAWGLLFAAVFLWLVGGFLWWQAGIEARVWNRCHPSQNLTQFEALMTRTRIDNCESVRSEKDE